MDTEADAAKLMAREAKVTELQGEVERLRGELAQHSAEAAKVSTCCVCWPGLGLVLLVGTLESVHTSGWKIYEA